MLPHFAFRLTCPENCNHEKSSSVFKKPKINGLLKKEKTELTVKTTKRLIKTKETGVKIEVNSYTSVLIWNIQILIAH